MAAPAPDATLTNRRARHEYHIETTVETGLVLEGWEVKSLRANRGHFTGAFARIIAGEVMLLGMVIEPLPTVRLADVRPDRPRTLLLHRREIAELVGRTEKAGMTLVPLRIYEKGGRFKLALGVARGKDNPDKRQALKERSIARDDHRVRR